MSTASYVMSFEQIAVMSAEQIDALEGVVQRISGFVMRAARVADRSKELPCLDTWATRERLARIADAVSAGERVLVRLASDW